MSSSILFIRRSLGLNSVLLRFLASSCALLSSLSVLGVGVGLIAVDLGLGGILSVGICRGVRVKGLLASRCRDGVFLGSRESACSGAGEGEGRSIGMRVGQVLGSGSGMLGTTL